MKKVVFLSGCVIAAVLSQAQLHPSVSCWKLNNGEKGSYYTIGANTPVSNNISANVQQVRFSTNNTYVNSTGIPDYPIGPYSDGNPSDAGDRNYLWKITHNPSEETGIKTSTGLGAIGVLINGVPIYNASDAMSYNNQGIWYRDAVYFENDGFDCSKGHPAPDMSDLTKGYYHHHQNPIVFSESSNPTSSICDDYPSDGLYTLNPSSHGPLIGYAFDGYPIYGAYGYSNPNDANSPIKRMEPSWQKRSITQRHTLPDGTTLSPSEFGPDVDGSYPLGAYIEDYEYIASSGDLDEHNGRFCVTPEYPSGTYAYFATIDSENNSAYPYFIGPTYYGVVLTENAAQNVTITESVQVFTGVEEKEATSFQMYPNPANDQLKIACEEKVLSVRFIDVLGKPFEVTYQASGDLLDIDLSNITGGIYQVQVQTSTGLASKKLMVQ